MEPDASMATRSVKVPPTSTPTPMRLTLRYAQAKSQADFLLLFGRLVDRLEYLVQLHLIGRRLVRRGLLDDRGEVRQLGAVRLEKRALTARCAGRRDIRCPAVELFYDPHRREPSAAACGEDLQPPPPFLADIRCRNLDHRHHPRDAFDRRDHRLLDRAGAAGALHRCRDSLCFRRFGQPEREVEQRRAMIEKRAAAGLGPTQTPSLRGTPE